MAAHAVVKTDEEWKAELDPAVYRVLRRGATEPAGAGPRRLCSLTACSMLSLAPSRWGPTPVPPPVLASRLHSSMFYRLLQLPASHPSTHPTSDLNAHQLHCWAALTRPFRAQASSTPSSPRSDTSPAGVRFSRVSRAVAASAASSTSSVLVPPGRSVCLTRSTHEPVAHGACGVSHCLHQAARRRCTRPSPSSTTAVRKDAAFTMRAPLPSRPSHCLCLAVPQVGLRSTCATTTATSVWLPSRPMGVRSGRHHMDIHAALRASSSPPCALLQLSFSSCVALEPPTTQTHTPASTPQHKANTQTQTCAHCHPSRPSPAVPLLHTRLPGDAVCQLRRPSRPRLLRWRRQDPGKRTAIHHESCSLFPMVTHSRSWVFSGAALN